MGEQAITLLNGKGTVAVITSLGATNLQNRLAGVKEALAKAPGIQIVETYDIQEDVLRCAEIIATGSRRYPNLSAWISVGGWPVFTRNALAAVDGSKTKVISFDTISPALDLCAKARSTCCSARSTSVGAASRCGCCAISRRASSRRRRLSIQAWTW